MYVVYHKTDNKKFHYLPLDVSQNPFAPESPARITSKKRGDLKNAVAERAWCFLIVGVGKPKRFYLWEYFQFLERDEESGVGKGFTLNPPQLLNGPDFEQFKSGACGSFGFGLQHLIDTPFANTLLEIARQYRNPRINKRTLQFCISLIKLCDYDSELKDDAKRFCRYVAGVLNEKRKKAAMARGKVKKEPDTTNRGRTKRATAATKQNRKRKRSQPVK